MWGIIEVSGLTTYVMIVVVPYSVVMYCFVAAPEFHTQRSHGKLCWLLLRNLPWRDTVFPVHLMMRAIVPVLLVSVIFVFVEQSWWRFVVASWAALYLSHLVAVMSYSFWFGEVVSYHPHFTMRYKKDSLRWLTRVVPICAAVGLGALFSVLSGPALPIAAVALIALMTLVIKSKFGILC